MLYFSSGVKDFLYLLMIASLSEMIAIISAVGGLPWYPNIDCRHPLVKKSKSLPHFPVNSTSTAILLGPVIHKISGCFTPAIDFCDISFGVLNESIFILIIALAVAF